MIRCGRNLLPSTVVVLLLAARAFGQTAFPTEGLKGRVGFWKKVFTSYGTDDVVIHDRFHVNLIYAVASDGTVDGRVRGVKESLAEIRDKIQVQETLSEASSEIYQA